MTQTLQKVCTAVTIENIKASNVHIGKGHVLGSSPTTVFKEEKRKKRKRKEERKKSCKILAGNII